MTENMYETEIGVGQYTNYDVRPTCGICTAAGIIGITLKTGSTDENAIRTLQRKLKSLGYYNSTINGTYGANTQEAVSNFQKQNGM